MKRADGETLYEAVTTAVPSLANYKCKHHYRYPQGYIVIYDQKAHGAIDVIVFHDMVIVKYDIFAGGYKVDHVQLSDPNCFPRLVKLVKDYEEGKGVPPDYLDFSS